MDPTENHFLALYAYITSTDVGKLKGDVASPGELKKKIEEVQAELDKKIHACEQHVLFNRTLLTVFLTAVVGLFFTTYVKQFVDGSQAVRQPPGTQDVGTAISVSAIRGLEWSIMVAGLIIGVAILCATHLYSRSKLMSQSSQ